MLNDRANSLNMFWGRVGFIDAINLHSFKIILILYDFNFSTFHFVLFGKLDFQMTSLKLNIEVITCSLLVMWSAFLLFVEFVITVNFEFWLVSWYSNTSSKKNSFKYRYYGCVLFWIATRQSNLYALKMYRVDFFLNIMIFKWLSSKYDFPCLSTPPIDERSNGRTYASLTSEKPISVKKWPDVSAVDDIIH